MVPRGASTAGRTVPGRKEAAMQEYRLLEDTKERHASLLREAQAVRQVLRSSRVDKSSPILKILILFLVSVV
jgi:hypothetical protein